MSCGCGGGKKNVPSRLSSEVIVPKSVPVEEYSLGEYVKDTLLRRVEKVSPEIQQKRLLICGKCPHINRPLFTCGICGCPMRRKTRVAKASCPLRMEKHGENPRWLPAAGNGQTEEFESSMVD